MVSPTASQTISTSVLRTPYQPGLNGAFLNGKPWVSPEIKAFLKEKKRVFRTGNKKNLRTIQRELRIKIMEGKDIYRKRMEDQLQQNDISGVWKGLKAMSGFKGPNQQPVGDQQWVNELNLFFKRFDQPSPLPHTRSTQTHRWH